MRNYRVKIIARGNNGRDDKVRYKFFERVGKDYVEMNGNEPRELRKIAEHNEEIVRDMRISKLELGVTID